MTKMVENQRNWNEYKITEKIGVICTYFSEQFLEESFQIIRLTPGNFQEEIELNGLDTIYIDNDIFEVDHDWYKKDRSELFRYFRKENRSHFSKNIIVIKNTSKKIASIFKKAFVLDIDYDLNKYLYQNYQLKIPLQINYKLVNPSQNQDEKIVDVVNLLIGNGNNNSLRNLDTNLISIKNIKYREISRESIFELIQFIKESKILNITLSEPEKIDRNTLKYIKLIASMSSTIVFYSEINPEPSSHLVENNIQVFLSNSDYFTKEVLYSQRKDLINHTSLINKSFLNFMKSENNILEFPKISIITVTNKPELLEKYFSQINSQKYIKLEVNLILHGFKLDINQKNKFQNENDFKINFIEASKQNTLGDCLNKGVIASDAKYIAKIDDDDLYSKYYMIDQWLALKYSCAHVVGKAGNLIYFEDSDTIFLRNEEKCFKYCDSINGSTIVTYKNILENFPFANISKATELNFFRRITNEALIIFSNHCYGMCVFRKKEKARHLLKVEDLVFKKEARLVGYGSPKKYIDL